MNSTCGVLFRTRGLVSRFHRGSADARLRVARPKVWRPAAGRHNDPRLQRNCFAVVACPPTHHVQGRLRREPQKPRDLAPRAPMLRVQCIGPCEGCDPQQPPQRFRTGRPEVALNGTQRHTHCTGGLLRPTPQPTTTIHPPQHHGCYLLHTNRGEQTLARGGQATVPTLAQRCQTSHSCQHHQGSCNLAARREKHIVDARPSELLKPRISSTVAARNNEQRSARRCGPERACKQRGFDRPAVQQHPRDQVAHTHLPRSTPGNGPRRHVEGALKFGPRRPRAVSDTIGTFPLVGIAQPSITRDWNADALEMRTRRRSAVDWRNYEWFRPSPKCRAGERGNLYSAATSAQSSTRRPFADEQPRAACDACPPKCTAVDQSASRWLPLSGCLSLFFGATSHSLTGSDRFNGR